MAESKFGIKNKIVFLYSIVALVIMIIMTITILTSDPIPYDALYRPMPLQQFYVAHPLVRTVLTYVGHGIVYIIILAIMITDIGRIEEKRKHDNKRKTHR